MVLVTPQSMTPVADIARVIAETEDITPKPITACLMGLADVADGVRVLNEHKVPTYAFPENAMRAMAAKTRFAEWIRSPVSKYVKSTSIARVDHSSPRSTRLGANNRELMPSRP